MDLNILYEDDSLIVLIKPPKIPTQPDKTGDKSMVYFLEEYFNSLKKQTFVGVVHRLDRPVGGIMVFAKSKAACERLSKEMQKNEFKKSYLAVVCGNAKKVDGELRNFLLKNQRLNSSKVVSENTKGAKEAVLNYKILESIETEEFGKVSLADIELLTGRHHQIRVQFSNAGIPLWGDNKYNDRFKNERQWTQIALWAKSLIFYHPVSGKRISFEQKPKEFPFNMFNI